MNIGLKFTFLVLVALILSGCREEFTCSCTAEDPIHNISKTQKLSKSAAEEWCRDWNFDDKIDEDTKKEGWKCVLK